MKFVQIVKYLKEKYDNSRIIYRAERLNKKQEEIQDDAISKYVFSSLLQIANQDYKIEILIKKADPCSVTGFDIKINGKQTDVHPNDNILHSLRRAMEQYNIDKI